MKVEFWGVGEVQAESLPMNAGNISAHLVADWLPFLPGSVTTSFLGWPQHLIETTKFNDEDGYLAMAAKAGKTDRQWKSVVSWMIGVAGTRHVLNKEGYRWIAPASAFYENSVVKVDPGEWHPSFPQTSLTVTQNPAIHSNLIPDYVAVREVAGNLEIAAAEAKGTSSNLSSKSECPEKWYEQAKNIVIRNNDDSVPVDRNIVVATRVNPNASQPATRRIQVRAWNLKRTSTHKSLIAGEAISMTAPFRKKATSNLNEAISNIVAGHLFGLFRNLHLNENARALAMAVHARKVVSEKGHISDSDLYRVSQLCEAADKEWKIKSLLDGPSSVIELKSGGVTAYVELDAAVTDLARKLRSHIDPELAAEAIGTANRQLNEWDKRRKDVEDTDSEAGMGSGIIVRLARR